MSIKPFGEMLAKQVAPEAGNSDPKQRAFGVGAMNTSMVNRHTPFEMKIQNFCHVTHDE